MATLTLHAKLRLLERYSVSFERAEFLGSLIGSAIDQGWAKELPHTCIKGSADYPGQTKAYLVTWDNRRYYPVVRDRAIVTFLRPSQIFYNKLHPVNG